MNGGHGEPPELAGLGAPASELTRSPAARKVGELAAASSLFLYHFECRTNLPPPEHLLPPQRPDLGQANGWQAGVLHENKYASFRNDLALGSFHPGHRAKWTAHELCHGLVGFAWRPGATPFFHALAARLAELLPVALYYFFDEAFLSRCEQHAGGGALFASFCPACEAAAPSGPLAVDRQGEWHLTQGKAFIERELAAVARSRRLGRPVASPWANLDLSADGLNYAAAQSTRLGSPEFERYAALFCPPECSRHASLDELEARILQLAGAITGEGVAPPWPGTRATWIAQDLGWRLLEVVSQCEGEVAVELDRMIDRLAATPREHTLAATIEDYRALHRDYLLPDPEELFAVGYALPGGLGLALDQIAEGIASACPRAWDLCGDAGERKQLVAAFAAADVPLRKPLGVRFAGWIAGRADEEISLLAEIESAMAHPPPIDAACLTLGWQVAGEDRIRLDPAVRFFRASASIMHCLGLEAEEDCLLVIRREQDGEMALLNLDPALQDVLAHLQNGPLPRAALDLDDETLGALAEAHVIAPDRWRD